MNARFPLLEYHEVSFVNRNTESVVRGSMMDFGDCGLKDPANVLNVS